MPTEVAAPEYFRLIGRLPRRREILKRKLKLPRPQTTETMATALLEDDEATASKTTELSTEALASADSGEAPAPAPTKPPPRGTPRGGGRRRRRGR